MTTIEQLEEQLNENKKELKSIRAEAKAIQKEIARKIEEEHDRIKNLLSDILIKAAAEKEGIKEMLLSCITNSKNLEDNDIHALNDLISSSNNKSEKISQTTKHQIPQASETDKQVNRFTRQPDLKDERANASFS